MGEEILRQMEQIAPGGYVRHASLRLCFHRVLQPLFSCRPILILIVGHFFHAHPSMQISAHTSSEVLP